jgi:N utilization substance protein B
MTTRRHRARRIALQLLYCAEVTGENRTERLAEQVGYLTLEEIMAESIASNLTEEEVEAKVNAILKDKEHRQRQRMQPRPMDESVGEICDFALELMQGALTFRETIDQRLSALSEHWRLERMSMVDRNILRLGAYEILFRSDIPPKVSIDEAVELAKEYGDEKSGGFVNGILDTLAEQRISESSTSKENSSK